MKTTHIPSGHVVIFTNNLYKFAYITYLILSINFYFLQKNFINKFMTE